MERITKFLSRSSLGTKLELIIVVLILVGAIITLSLGGSVRPSTIQIVHSPNPTNVYGDTTSGGKARHLTTDLVRETSLCELTWSERLHLQLVIRSVISPEWKSMLRSELILQRVSSSHYPTWPSKPPAFRKFRATIMAPYILTSHNFPEKVRPGT